MARVTGFGTGFDAAAFRTAIKNTMRMGAPQDTNERATFIWTTTKTYSRADSGGKPWTKDASVQTTSAHDPVQIDVAVEFVPRSTLAGGTPVGNFETPRAIITVLDEDYALIEGADKVLLGENTYNIDFVAPPIGLFEVTVYQLHCSARDES